MRKGTVLWITEKKKSMSVRVCKLCNYAIQHNISYSVLIVNTYLCRSLFVILCSCCANNHKIKSYTNVYDFSTNYLLNRHFDALFVL